MLRILDPDAHALARHLAWITSAACLLLSAMVLYGKIRLLVMTVLILATGGSALGIVGASELGWPLVPVSEEVARVPCRGGSLVGLRVNSLDEPVQILVCKQIKLMPQVLWNDVLFRMRNADDVYFKPTSDGSRRFTCYFPPRHPGLGEPLRSHTVYMRR